MENKPLKFIDVIDVNTGRKSFLSINGRLSNNALTWYKTHLGIS